MISKFWKTGRGSLVCVATEVTNPEPGSLQRAAHIELRRLLVTEGKVSPAGTRCVTGGLMLTGTSNRCHNSLGLTCGNDRAFCREGSVHHMAHFRFVTTVQTATKLAHVDRARMPSKFVDTCFTYPSKQCDSELNMAMFIPMLHHSGVHATLVKDVHLLLNYQLQDTLIDALQNTQI